MNSAENQLSILEAELEQYHDIWAWADNQLEITKDEILLTYGGPTVWIEHNDGNPVLYYHYGNVQDHIYLGEPTKNKINSLFEGN